MAWGIRLYGVNLGFRAYGFWGLGVKGVTGLGFGV